VITHRFRTSKVDANRRSFPFFHWPSFTAKVQGEHYTTDQAFYVTVMAVCAIVVARKQNNREHQSLHPSTSSKSFYQAAVEGFPANLTHAQGFEFKRAKVLLAITCIQHGAILEHQTYLGEYIVMACNDGFQDEDRWEPSLSEISRQERRRLVGPSACVMCSTNHSLAVLVSVHPRSFFCHYVGWYDTVSRTSMQRTIPGGGG
jgi:hypothetical protein